MDVKVKIKGIRCKRISIDKWRDWSIQVILNINNNRYRVGDVVTNISKH